MIQKPWLYFSELCSNLRSLSLYHITINIIIVYGYARTKNDV